MTAWRKAAIALCVSLILIGAVAAALTALNSMARKGTIFAPGYTEDGFRQVRTGMSAPQVESLLGQPLEKSESSWDCGFVEVWVYTRQRNDRSWWQVRHVLFETETGRVCDTIRATFEP